MKRYWVFGFDQYYPRGGMNDFLGAFPTIKEAYQFIEEERKKDFPHDAYEVEDAFKYLDIEEVED